jgi:undecaprenyl-diphosphatase
MTWLQGLVLGVVQGLTEFLPVSSSGQMVVTQAMFGLAMPGVYLSRNAVG